MNTRAIRCPSCQGALVPVKLHCDACDLSVVGRFAGNEFSTLGEDDLHFLRIFVRCEGRIRDMESAMGVSYPTIKQRMAQLKQALSSEPAPAEDGAPKSDDGVGRVLNELHAGRLTYDAALEQIRQLQKEKPS